MPVSLHHETLAALHNTKNLLAFSSGSDSSALFHLLQQQGIAFDIIHVNYHTREQSNIEAHHARRIAATHDKKCFIKDVSLTSSNFEHRARNKRYAFFHEIICQHGYETLITAHQLNDRLEWFFMQLCKGSGLYELVGMQQIEQREDYMLVRPLLHVTSHAIMQYLAEHKIEYFVDESNSDGHFLRNHFREHYATPMLQTYAGGIAKSFTLLEEDIDTLVHDADIFHVNRLSYFRCPGNRRSTVIVIDKILKTRGCVMSGHEKDLLKHSNTLVVARKFVVVIAESYCFIAPYVKTVMSKAFKERCRILNIEPKLRGYLFSDTDSFERVKSLFG